MQIGLEAIIPEVILIFMVFLLILVNFRSSVSSRSISFTVLLTGAIAAMLALTLVGEFSGPRAIFAGTLMVDPISSFFRILFYILLVLVVINAFRSVEVSGYLFGESLILMTASTVGLAFMVTSNDLIMLYLSIEIVSLTSYLLTGYKPKNMFSSEAAVKYVLFGGVASAIMLFGMSYLYGMARSLNIGEIILYLNSSQESNALIILAYLMVLVGFFYKIAAVPFHYWSPDVYQSAPTPVTAFFSIGPKAAGMGVIIRFFTVYHNTAIQEELTIIIGIVAAITMTVGNLTALRQENIKRMLAYSSIAHAGYMLMGLVVFNTTGIKAVLFYLFAYLIMNLGAFIIVSVIINAWKTEQIEDYRELGWKGGRNTLLAVILSVFLFSLAGIPPFAGFIGKWYLFAALIESGSSFYWLAVIGVINSVIALFYYARIVKKMFLDRYDNPMLMDMKNKDRKIETEFTFPVLLSLLGIATLVFGIFFSPVFDILNMIV